MSRVSHAKPVIGTNPTVDYVMKERQTDECDLLRVNALCSSAYETGVQSEMSTCNLIGISGAIFAFYFEYQLQESELASA